MCESYAMVAARTIKRKEMAVVVTFSEYGIVYDKSGCGLWVKKNIDVKIKAVYSILFVSGRTAPTRTNLGPFPNTMD